jgi:hypothetical protein
MTAAKARQVYVRVTSTIQIRSESTSTIPHLDASKVHYYGPFEGEEAAEFIRTIRGNLRARRIRNISLRFKFLYFVPNGNPVFDAGYMI